MLINALRGHLAEFGIIAATGRHHVADLRGLLQEADSAEVPALARQALVALIAELHALEQHIEAIEGMILPEQKANPVFGPSGPASRAGKSAPIAAACCGP